MGGAVITIGSTDSLHFQIRWSDLKRRATSAEATQGGLLLWIGDKLVWGREATAKPRAVQWTWIEFLEFLSRSWNYLLWEEGYPLGLSPGEPTEIYTVARDHWQNMSEEQFRREEHELYAYADTHDLAKAIRGAKLPSIWLVKEGRQMLVSSMVQTKVYSCDEILDTLSRWGDAIASRLESLDDKRAIHATELWKTRNTLGAGDFVKIATRLPDETIAALEGSIAKEDFWEIRNDQREVTEVLAAARMSQGDLSKTDLGRLLNQIRDIPKQEIPDLEKLSEAAAGLNIETTSTRPFDQGQKLAQWLRQKLGCDKKISVKSVLNQMNVPIYNISLPCPQLDAVACWGKRHGPAIVINDNGKHARDLHGRRATLAHEVCHLLVDRYRALPVAEVLNGSVMKSIEARARAFAAEFLLPQTVAYDHVGNAADVSSAVNQLSKEYRVSTEIVAWQVRHSHKPLSSDMAAILKKFVSHPDRY